VVFIITIMEGDIIIIKEILSIFCIMIISGCIIPVDCQEDEQPPGITNIGIDHPVMIPFPADVVDEANKKIIDTVSVLLSPVSPVCNTCFFEEQLAKQNQYNFLYDNWTLNLTNSTGLFIA
jgi:hypothetical protein